MKQKTTPVESLKPISYGAFSPASKVDRRTWLSAAASAFGLNCLLDSFPTPQLFGGEVPSPASTTDSPLTTSVQFREKGETKSVQGELVAEREGFGLLVLDADGLLTAISPDELISKESLATPLEPTKPMDLGQKILRWMPPNSRVLASEHFLLCYNTTEAYARWNVDLYERLYRGFHRFWKSKGFELTPPRFPLVSLIFETKADYVRYASQEFQGSENTFGYYHQGTNRLASYDLTGVEGMIPSNMRVNRDTLVQQILSRPEAERTVATIVHEACHQIAFNCGLQTRLGASPLWLSEGLATYFESPDLTSKGGWGGIGKINQHNYNNLVQYLPVRTPDSLTLLLSDDSRLRNGETMTQAYAEAWGLTHFLVQTRAKDFVKYLQGVREIPIGTQPSTRERLDMFRSCFGDDLTKIDRDFLRHLQRLR